MCLCGHVGMCQFMSVCVCVYVCIYVWDVLLPFQFRLKHSGLQEKIILIESYGSMQHFSISEDRIKQAIVNAQVWSCFGWNFTCIPGWKSSGCVSWSLSVHHPAADGHHFNSKLPGVSGDRLVGLVVRRLPRERMILGSNPASAGIFRGRVIPVT